MHISIGVAIALFAMGNFSLVSAQTAPIFTQTGGSMQQPCANGQQGHVANQKEADAAGGKGIIAGVTWICPSAATVNITNDAGSAKDYLKTVAHGNSSCDASNPKNIDGLNNSFAICAAAFVKAYQARYGALQINTSYRPPSVNSCVGGAKDSNHTRGIAMDIKPQGAFHNPADKPKYQTMWKFASDNPQFGVCFPFQDKPLTGYPDGDWPHMILAGTGGREATACAAQNVTKACEAGKFDPKSISPGGGNALGDDGYLSTPQCTSLYCQTPGISPAGMCPMGSQALSNGMGGFTCIPAGMQCPANMISYQGQCFPFNNTSFPQAQSTPSTAQPTPSTGGFAGTPTGSTAGTVTPSSPLTSSSADLSSILSGSATTSLLFTAAGTTSNRIATSSTMSELLNLTGSDSYYTSTNPSAASGTLAINSDSATDIAQLNPAGTDGWNVSSSNASADEDSATSSVVHSTSSASSVIHTTQPPPGSQTFTSRDLSESDSVRNTTTSPSFAGTFVNNTYAILEGLRQQLLRAYYFLISIGKK